MLVGHGFCEVFYLFILWDRFCEVVRMAIFPLSLSQRYQKSSKIM